MRARAVHDAIRLLDEFKKGATNNVRQRIPPDSLVVIEETTTLGWIDVVHDHHVPASIIAELGPEPSHAYFRWLLTRQLDSPLLRSTLRATRKLFGLSPAAMARAVPLGWSMVYRDFCVPKVVDQSADRVTILMEQVNAQVLEIAAYRESFRGFFGGFFDACEVDGEVTTQVDLAEASIAFKLVWGSPSAG